MMRWFIIAAAILVVAGIFSLIKSLTNNRKEGTESQTATPQPEQKIKFKAGYGKMWNWIIPIGIISPPHLACDFGDIMPDINNP